MLTSRAPHSLQNRQSGAFLAAHPEQRILRAHFFKSRGHLGTSDNCLSGDPSVPKAGKILSPIPGALCNRTRHQSSKAPGGSLRIRHASLQLLDRRKRSFASRVVATRRTRLQRNIAPNKDIEHAVAATSTNGMVRQFSCPRHARCSNQNTIPTAAMHTRLPCWVMNVTFDLSELRPLCPRSRPNNGHQASMCSTAPLNGGHFAKRYHTQLSSAVSVRRAAVAYWIFQNLK